MERVVSLGVPQTVVVNLRAGLAGQIEVAPNHRAIIGQNGAVEINGTGSGATSQVHHGVAGNGQAAGKHKEIGLERAVDDRVAARQVPVGETGAGESRVAGQNISVKAKVCGTGDIVHPATAATPNFQSADLDIHGAGVVEGDVVVQYAVGPRRSRFAEGAKVVEEGGAARIAPMERVVSLSIPQTVVVNLRAGLAIQIHVAPYHCPVVGERSSECERVVTDQKGRIVAVIHLAQDKTAHHRFNVHHDGIIAIVGDDSDIGQSRYLVGGPVGGRTPVAARSVCPNDNSRYRNIG